MTAVVEPALIKTPGVYEDIPEDLYHRGCVEGGSLSSTGARTLTHKTPAHFDWERRNPRAPKVDWDIGSAAHALVLGRGAEIEVIDADTYNTKAARQQRDEAYAAGRVPLLPKQMAGAERMADAIRAHSKAGKLFARADCRPEVTIVGRDPETGVMCRVRVDWLLPIDRTKPITFVDLKTLDDASRYGLAKSMTSWNYHQQIAFYGSVIRWALDLEPDHPVGAVLVGVEKDQPHLVGIGEPDEQAVAWAQQDNRKALHLYRRCTETNDWPGHDEGVVSLSLPGWRLNAYENTYPTGLYEPDDEIGDVA